MGFSDDIDALVGDWLTLEQAAERLEAGVATVRQLLREHKLIGVRRGSEVRVPAAFMQDAAVLKGLPGTLTVLADAGYSDDEALRWLFSSDDSLPGSPVRALIENRGTEVKRRAQALAF